MTISNCVVSNNRGSSYGEFFIGGGFAIYGGSVTLSNVNVSSNEANSANGGGGFAIAGGSVTISNSVISHNKASCGIGMGYHVGQFSQI